MKMRKMQMTKFWYALIQIVLWGGYGVIICYCSNFLKAMGFQDSHVSIVLGVASGAAIVIQLLMAEMIQTIPVLSTEKGIVVQAIFILVAGLFMFQSEKMTIVAAVGIGIACVALQTMPSLANSLATESEQAGNPVNFSIARGMGSLAYSVASFATGRLIGSTGIKVITFLTIEIGVVLCLAAFMFEQTGRERKPDQKEKAEKKEKTDTSVKQFFKKYPFLKWLLLGSVLLYINHNLVSTFMQQIIEAKGAGASEQGTAIAIAGLLELPPMFGFAYLLKKASSARWVQISCICFVMKAVIMLIAPNYVWIYIAQIFQMGGFAIYTVSSVEYIASVTEAEDAVRAQTYLATTITVGSLIAMSIGGFICQYVGVSVMIGVAVALAVVGMLIVGNAVRQKTE